MEYSHKSAVAEHVHESEPPHEIDWKSITVIDKAKGRLERKIREAFSIQKRKPVINRDGGVEKSTVWDVVL